VSAPHRADIGHFLQGRGTCLQEVSGITMAIPKQHALLYGPLVTMHRFFVEPNSDDVTVKSLVTSLDVCLTESITCL
jgi:hypothetical protein